MESLLNEIQLAETLGMSVAALRRWRYENRGPAWVKLGSAVRYKQDAVLDWLQSCPTGSGNLQSEVNL